MAEPPDKTMSIPKNNRMIINGISQNFFLVFKKSTKSLISSILFVLKWF
jgi:hypothetical protein